jgi:hypothetical protein
MVAYSLVLAAVPGIDLWWWFAGICAWVIVGATVIWTMKDDGSAAEALTPGWRSNLAVVVLVVFSCSAISVPDGYTDRFIVSALLWLVAGGVWLVGLIASLTAQRGRVRKNHRIAWLVQPMLAALMVALAITQAPLWATYLLSKDAMNDQAGAVLAGKDPRTIKRIGVYRVSWAERDGDLFRFEIDGAGGGAGFAYTRGGQPPCVNYDGCYKHWDGPWYTYTVPDSD